MDDLPLSEMKKIMIERAKKDDTTSKIKSTRTVKKTCQTQVEKPVDEVKKTSSNSKGMSLRKERKANIPFTLTQDPNNPKKYIQSNQSIKISDSTIIPLKSVSSNKRPLLLNKPHHLQKK
jgi:primase-polymerase (primpol)-like protein